MVEIKAQKIILVTGATGYIGSQIVNHLVQEKKFENYIIRCAVRDPENMSKIEPLKTFFTPEQFARLEMFKVDLLEHASIDKAVEGCQFVIHCAQPVTSDNSERELVINTAVQGTKSVMIAAQKHGVERIVYTGSISAMYNFREIPQVINETHWNDLTLPKLSAYDVSKTLAELAAWDFIKEIKDGEHKPELVSILPGFTTGKIIGKGASSSVDIIKFLMRGAMSKVPRLEMKCVDVHDVAQAHVRSLFIPEAAGHRFILVDRPVWLQEIAQTLAEHYDGKEQPKLPIPTKEYSLIEMWIGSWFSAPAAAAYSYWNKQHNFDTSPSKIILGIEYARHPKECFLETANDFITSGAVRIN